MHNCTHESSTSSSKMPQHICLCLAADNLAVNHLDVLPTLYAPTCRLQKGPRSHPVIVSLPSGIRILAPAVQNTYKDNMRSRQRTGPAAALPAGLHTTVAGGLSATTQPSNTGCPPVHHCRTGSQMQQEEDRLSPQAHKICSWVIRAAVLRAWLGERDVGSRERLVGV